MLQDMRQALRVIHRNPGYVAAAVLTLAIGIGATTAIFTLTDAVLLRPLDVHDASRVFALRTTNFRGEPYEGFLYRQVVDLKATLANALDLAIQFPDDVIVATPGGLSRRRAAFVSANYFEVLGRPPVRGGDFAVADDSPGAEPRVILGHSFWTSAFAASDSAVGSRLLVSGVAVTIAGVAAPRQRGIDLQAPVDLFLPAHLIQRTTTLPGNTGNYFFQDGSPGFSPGNYWRMFGRLAPGVSRQSAASIAVCRSCTDQKIALVSVQTAAVPARLRGDVSRFSTILFVAVTVVLLMVCANLAGLLLAQTERRRREIGVRLALGASRPRIFMHLVLESAVVATMGCVAGLALSRLILSGLVSFELPGFIALSSLALAVNGRMLAFAALVSVASALLVSIASARTAAATDVISALKHGGSPAGRGRARQVLVGAHVALSIVLALVPASSSAACRPRCLWMSASTPRGLWSQIQTSAPRVFPTRAQHSISTRQWLDCLQRPA